MNTFYNHRESHKCTWYRWNSDIDDYRDKSMIDLVLTHNRSLFRDVKTIPSISFDSDHRLVLIKMKLRKPKTRRQQVSERFLLENLKQRDCQERYRDAIRIASEGRVVVDDGDEEWIFFQEFC